MPGSLDAPANHKKGDRMTGTRIALWSAALVLTILAPLVLVAVPLALCLLALLARYEVGKRARTRTTRAEVARRRVRARREAALWLSRP